MRRGTWVTLPTFSPAALLQGGGGSRQGRRPHGQISPQNLHPLLRCCRKEQEEKEAVEKKGHMGDFYRNLLRSNVAFGAK